MQIIGQRCRSDESRIDTAINNVSEIQVCKRIRLPGSHLDALFQTPLFLLRQENLMLTNVHIIALQALDFWKSSPYNTIVS